VHRYQLFEDSVEGSRWVPSAVPGYACQVHRRSGVTWLVAPGLAMIAVTYGLARVAYGLFLPEIRESLDLSETALGYIGAGSYAGYCLAIVAALVFTSRTGPRFMAVAAGAVAVVGMAVVAALPRRGCWQSGYRLRVAAAGSPHRLSWISPTRPRFPSLRRAISPEDGQCARVPVRRPALRARLQLSYTNQRRVIHGVLTTLDPSLTLTRTQHSAIPSNRGNKKPLIYAGFANLCNAQQPLTAHS
jgi:hypothetical protein